MTVFDELKARGLLAQLTDLIKVAIGFVLVKKGVWIKTIVEHTETSE